MNATNPDHPITCSREAARVEVLYEDHQIADSADVLLLREAGYAPVRYFPRSDVAMPFLRKTDKVTHCPYKGAATYYTIHRDGRMIENAAWSYETPFLAVGEIAGRLAFYPRYVEFRQAELEPAETTAVDVDAVVQHTDSGSGASQAEHWEANVFMPDDQGDEVRDGDPSPVPRSSEGTGSI